jgi:hypothetical protein
MTTVIRGTSVFAKYYRKQYNLNIADDGKTAAIEGALAGRPRKGSFFILST